MIGSGREGVLVPTPDGRLAIQPGTRSVDGLHGLHCGDGMELWHGGRYLPGRVEHDRQGWYWTDDQKSIDLRPGMRARGYVG